MTQPINLASLTYMHPTTLASLLQTNPSSVAIIDVRDSDYLGGHIKGNTHIPTSQLDAHMPELLRTLKGKDKVVFHCMLSQQRGPSSALKYARAKAAQGGDAEVERVDEGDEVVVRKIAGQEICVLEGGFQEWQARFGGDPGLTEGYVKELWESVFS